MAAPPPTVGLPAVAVTQGVPERLGENTERQKGARTAHTPRVGTQGYTVAPDCDETGSDPETPGV